MSKLDLGNNEFINYEFHENIGKNTIFFSNSLGSDLSMWDPQAEYFKDCLLYTSPSPRDQ